MLVKSPFTDTIKLSKPAFGKIPEKLYSVYVTQGIVKFIDAIIDEKMFVIPNIYQSVIALLAIGVNDTFRINFTPYNKLKHLFTSIMNNLGINFPFSFKDDKNNGFTRNTPAALAGNSSGAEARFINFINTDKRSRLLTLFGNFTTQFVKDHSNRSHRNQTQLNGFCSS